VTTTGGFGQNNSNLDTKFDLAKFEIKTFIKMWTSHGINRCFFVRIALNVLISNLGCASKPILLQLTVKTQLDFVFTVS